ncbi:MAG: DUF2190 family protein [Ignavibacteria bacterium]|nr:DUF2190 family protein [Ignavibacteria bacterium]
MKIQTKTYQPILTLTIKTSDEIPANRFVGYNQGICGDNQKALGVAHTSWSAGEYASVVVLGTAIVEASGSINNGEKVTSDSQGKAKAWSSGAEVNGRALGSAVAGDLVRILLVP